MASPALEIAQKTNDASLQIWAALLIKGQVFSVQEYQLIHLVNFRPAADVW